MIVPRILLGSDPLNLAAIVKKKNKANLLLVLVLVPRVDQNDVFNGRSSPIKLVV